MGNFVNITYSLALRHQLYQCYLHLNLNQLPGEELEIGHGYKEILPKYSFFNEGTQFEFINDTYTRVNWVIQKGIKYQEGAAVVIGVEDEELVFGQIIAVYIVMEQILLLINLLKTVEFDQRRNAYVVTRKNEYYYTWPSDLDFRVFGVYLISNSETLETRYHIVLKYNVLT